MPCDLPITLVSVDPENQVSVSCQVVQANLRGCAVRAAHPLGKNTAVELYGLPATPVVKARVVTCISLGKQDNIWLLGLETDTPGNWWGIEPMPADWSM